MWDHPRTPRVEADARRVRIVCGRTAIDTTDAVRVLETSHPLAAGAAWSSPLPTAGYEVY